MQPPPSGSALHVRPDLKSLHINQISTLAHYITDECKEMIHVKGKEAKGEKVGRLELVKRLINSVAFKKYFEETKKQEQITDRTTWNDAHYPGET